MTVQLVPEGLLIGADRNVTSQIGRGGVIRLGQTRRPKVLKWPNREIVIGYIGLADIADQPTDEWLYRFIGRHLTGNLGGLARALKEELDAETLPPDEPLIVHLGGFERAGDQWQPEVWFIRNSRHLNPKTGRYEQIHRDFLLSEEISRPDYFGKATGDEIRRQVERMAKSWQPFWFHQGYDLGTFNVLDDVVRKGMRALIEGHPWQRHPFPATLNEWAKHLRMAICTYGAYFEAFYEPFEQHVGEAPTWSGCRGLTSASRIIR